MIINFSTLISQLLLLSSNSLKESKTFFLVNLAYLNLNLKQFTRISLVFF